jgi:acyl-CoA synthetase (AMP-forming)/AMP-acid ligase II
MAFAWIAAQPVPPFVTGRMPVTSLARFTSAVATTPAVAFKKPVREPIERFDVNKFVELAIVEKKFVVVPFVPVALAYVKFCSVDEPVTNKFVNVASPLPAREKSELPAEDRTVKRFAVWPGAPRIVSGTTPDDVASTVSVELFAGVVVPIED